MLNKYLFVVGDYPLHFSGATAE